jgi:hypothetical protein
MIIGAAAGRLSNLTDRHGTVVTPPAPGIEAQGFRNEEGARLRMANATLLGTTLQGNFDDAAGRLTARDEGG